MIDRNHPVAAKHTDFVLHILYMHCVNMRLGSMLLNFATQKLKEYILQTRTVFLQAYFTDMSRG